MAILQGITKILNKFIVKTDFVLFILPMGTMIHKFYIFDLKSKQGNSLLTITR